MKRNWLVVAAILLTIAFAGYLTLRPTGLDAPKIVVLSYGGAFEAAQKKAFYDPFTKATGIKVEPASYGGEYGQLKAAVEASQRSQTPPLYDVVDIESSALMRGISDGIYETIELSDSDRKDLIPEAVNAYGIGTDFYSVSLGWNTKAFPSSSPQPATWADFWDTKRFPGPRSLKRDARFTLEIALLADGVPHDQIYAGGKLDVDRAFRSLDRIRPSVSVWWTTGQQPIQLLSQGEVVMVAAFGARLFAAQHTDHAPLAMTWKNGVIDIEYWSILKGTGKPKFAKDFIAFASRPEAQARLPESLPLGPVNKQAFALMKPELSAELNTSPDNFPTQVLLSSRYWASNEAEIQDRFNRWLAK